MDFGVSNVGMSGLHMPMPSFGLGPDPAFPEIQSNRVIGIDITFTSAGKPPIRRSFLRSEFKSVHLGREPAEISGVANAFARTDVVPPVMSRKHAEIMFAHPHDAPQVVDIGSYHGTYFQSTGMRLVPNEPYPLWDGSVLEFGKSVMKDDKAHEPLTATIKFIHGPDRMRELSLLFSPGSPPRRYGVPSDSEDEDDDLDEDEEEDEDESRTSGSRSGSVSDVFEYTPEGMQPTHIDLTSMSDDDAHKFNDSRDGIEYLGFGYAHKHAYHQESISSSDMSESEYEDDAAKTVSLQPPRIFEAALPVPVAHEAAAVHVPEPRGLEMPVSHAGPSEEVRTLKVQLAVAESEISALKRVVERQAEVDREREAQKDKDGDVQIVEQQPDVPLRIANIEGMVRQLASLGDEEIGQHRSVVGEMLGQLDAGMEALRIRVGISQPSLGNNKRKRDEEDEDLVVESRRAQSPLPTTSVSTQATAPTPAPSPSKRSRIGDVALLAAGAVGMWGALAFDVI